LNKRTKTAKVEIRVGPVRIRKVSS